MQNEIAITRRRAELEDLDLKRAAIQSEIAALERADEALPVMRMESFVKLAPAEQSAYCAEVRAGKAKLID